MFGSLYKHEWDDNRFIFIRNDHRFPVAAYTKRNWKLIASNVDAADLRIAEDALHRGWYLELRKDVAHKLPFKVP